MALTAQNSPLVSGATYDLKNGRHGAKPGRLRVVRAFCVAGERQEAGTIVQLDAATASELISAGKLVRESIPAPAPAPASKDNKPAAATTAAKDKDHVQQ
jgi:hypothetical protein